MTLKNVQYIYAEDLQEVERKDLGISVDKGLVAIETRNEEINRTPKSLGTGIIDYIQSLD